MATTMAFTMAEAYVVRMEGQGLKQMRRDLKLTQCELAGRLGVMPETIGAWERGKRRVPKTVDRLLAAGAQFKKTITAD